MMSWEINLNLNFIILIYNVRYWPAEKSSSATETAVLY